MFERFKPKPKSPEEIAAREEQSRIQSEKDARVYAGGFTAGHGTYNDELSSKPVKPAANPEEARQREAEGYAKAFTAPFGPYDDELSSKDKK